MKQFIRKHIIPSEINNYYPTVVKKLVLVIIFIFIFFINFINKSNINASNLNIDKIVYLINEERIQNGLEPLIKNNLLEKAALKKLNDMLNKQYWNHYGPNGETPWEFILGVGYNYKYAGENLAKDFYSSESVVKAWLNSPTHKANILNPLYQETGIAVLNGNLNGKETILIAQLFGTQYQLTNNSVKTNKTHNFVYDETPRIIKPENNTFTNQKIIELLGESKIGDKAIIYVNKNFLGEIIINGGIFSERIELEDGKNTIEVAAKDSKNDSISAVSNTIQVNLDVIPPKLNLEDISFYNLKDNNYYLILIKNNFDEIYKAELFINNKVLLLNKYADYFWLKLDKDNQNFQINVYDRAGNITNLNIQPNELIFKNESEIPLFIYSNVQNQNETNYLNIFSIKNLSSISVINTILIGLMLLIYIIDASILIKFNKIRYNSSRHYLNVPLLIIAFIITLAI